MLVGAAGCAATQETESPSELGARERLSPEQCTERGGVQVGDPGDGRVHRPDYVCASGKAPLGTLVFNFENGPAPIEGAVCCAK